MDVSGLKAKGAKDPGTATTDSMKRTVVNVNLVKGFIHC